MLGRILIILLMVASWNIMPQLHAASRKSVSQRAVFLKLGEEVGVVQKRNFTKDFKVEFSPFMIGTITNDPFLNNYLYGVALTGHVNDQFGIEFQYFMAKTEENELNRVLQNDYGKEVVSGKTSNMFNVNLLWTPMYGKFSLFTKYIIFLDTYFTVGAGMTKTHLANAMTVNVGVGQRYFLNKWLAIRADLRDYIHKETRNTTVINKKNMVITLGISFFYPDRKN
jgi:outer membrane beta-barrel protein